MFLSNEKVNHGVLIVGWGTENNIPYWLIKNSWGPGWGDSGYIKVKRGTCYINKYASVPLVSVKTTGQADPVNPAPPCKGGDSCCTILKQCDVGEGDCDTDKHCKDDLVCGTDNCAGSTFDSGDDCCAEPGEGKNIILFIRPR